ncbi:MAG: peptidase C39 family protein [Eubacteriaceae bacterium]|nr:peptidase C39 family protein [Eubacteriaceae bacterium]
MNKTMRRKRTKRKRKNLARTRLALILIVTFALLSTGFQIYRQIQIRKVLAKLPVELQTLYQKNPEARKFVLNYEKNVGIDHPVDLNKELRSGDVPLLMQWDERWGYHTYAGNLLGLTGCGPTCLSMVATHLTGNGELNPKWIADFSQENGFATEESGSSWTLISEGAPLLGIEAIEIAPDEMRMAENIQVGNPIICVLGPGDFTDEGHFIVLTGYDQNGFTIKDPNRAANSKKTWPFETLRKQMLNLWVMRKSD